MLVHMKNVNISYARNNFSSLIKRVKRGLRVPIREREQIVAYLIPPPALEGISEFGELEQSGLIRSPQQQLQPEDIEKLTALPKLGIDLEAVILAHRKEDR